MQFGTARVGMAAVFAAVLTLMLTGITAAHEQHATGDYVLTVGFSNEPALVGEPNGLDLRVQKGEGKDGTPVEGIDATLRAEVIYGGETMPLELRAKFGQPGAYTADLIPTKTGAYTFHISGDIEGTPIDASFTSGPETFSEVEGKEAISFPPLTAGTTDGDSTNNAQTLAIVGIVVGALGVIAGLAGIAMARGARAASASGNGNTGDQG